MEKKDIPGFEETHSRLESLSILDCNTIQDIQEFVDMDLNGWTFIDETGDRRTETTIDTEPDWIPEC
mgnify:FL=1